jgi:chromosome partitioning protein
MAILDLPPLLVPTLASALMIADLILIPITPSALDVAPTERTLRMARMTRESRAGRKPKGLLVPNRVDPEAQYDPATQAAVAQLADRWAPELRHDVRHVDAFATGTWIGDHAPRSTASGDVLALADAVEELLEIKRRFTAPNAEDAAVAARAPGAKVTA